MNKEPSNTSKYQTLKEIGRGHFGTVEIIKRIPDGKLLVWKKVKYGAMNSQQKQQVISQVNILKDMNHPNIVRYYDRIVDKPNTTVHIVMEYCPGGDLNHRLQQLKQKKQYLDQSVIWKIFHQLISSLNYCHNRERKILHRDIKPANIFIDSNGQNIKLGDFGLSKQLGQYSQYANTYVGTPYYMSPEQTLNEKYNEKSDIWSVGCIIYEIASLKRPFSGQNVFDLASKIRSGKFQRIPLIYSENLYMAIKWMLRVNPQHRPTTMDLLSLPMMKSRNDDRQIKQKIEYLRKKQYHLKDKEQKLLDRLKQLRKLQQESEKRQYAIEKINRVQSSTEKYSPQHYSKKICQNVNPYKNTINSLKTGSVKINSIKY